MGISSDILGLFRRIEVCPEQYQEISRERRDQRSDRCWPGLTPEPQPQSQDESALLFPAGSEPSARLTHAPAAPVRLAATPPSELTKTEPTGWSSDSLKDLLAQLKHAENEAVAIATEKAARDQLMQPAAPVLGKINIITVMSSKGGVGKSTIATNLAVGLTKLGRSVLLVDLDPQNALIHHVQAKDPSLVEGSGSGIATPDGNDSDWRTRCVATIAGPVLLPHGLIEESERQTFEALLERDQHWLGRHLEAMNLADGAVVVLDTPPGPSPYLRQALAITRQALIVSLSDAASYTALPLAEKLISRYVGERDDFFGCGHLVNQVDRARQLNRDISLIMQQALGQRLVGMIHRDQSVSDALAFNRTAIEQESHGQGFQDLIRLAHAVNDRLPYVQESVATK